MAKVAVVGAGLGGLSAAIRLAAAGYQVDVFEKQDFSGGKAGELRLGQYRFDTGPSLLTMPEVFDQLFSEAGKNREDYLTFDPLDPLCTYFYPDGTVLHSYSDTERYAEEIVNATGEPRENLNRYLKAAGRIYDITAELFLWKSLHELKTYTSFSSLKSIAMLPRIGALSSLDAFNRRYFRDPKLVQLFNRYATYNGSDPYKTPGTFSIIPYIEHTFGGYAVEGGIYAIPQALTRLAGELGVTIHTGVQVDAVLSRNKQITGITVEGEMLEYPIVVSNVDVSRTYSTLLSDTQSKWAKKYSRMEMSSSGLVYMWGIKEKFSQLGVHNILFSPDYRKEFHQLFDEDLCPEEPTVYINITSKVTPSDASANGENWFVLLNVPPNRDQNWDQATAAVRERILTSISRALGKNLEELIEVEEILTPAQIEDKTGSTMGSLYGLSSNSRMAAFNRHPNRSGTYRGLYFCGGSAHPGGGMPLVTLSGKIVADLVKKYEKAEIKRLFVNA